MAIAEIDAKVVMPGARPPQESYAEMVKTGLMDKIKVGASTAMYPDGAGCWNRLAKEYNIPVRSVPHCQKVYAKPATLDCFQTFFFRK